MNPDYEKALEARVDRALSQLPELSAPRTLLPRIRVALDRRVSMPWYRQSWLAWPAPLRSCSLALLGTLFVALSWGIAQMPLSPGVSTVMREINHWRSISDAIGGAVQDLSGTVFLLLSHLGPRFLTGCGLVLILASVVCMGLGTVCVRFAFAHPDAFGFERNV